MISNNKDALLSNALGNDKILHSCTQWRVKKYRIKSAVHGSKEHDKKLVLLKPRIVHASSYEDKRRRSHNNAQAMTKREKIYIKGLAKGNVARVTRKR
jgi:hypothetical protein